MLRALLLILLFVVLYPLLVRLLRAPQGSSARPGAGPVAQMVRCAHCAVFVPAPDALSDGGNHYCSAEHRRLGPAPKP